MVLTLNHPNKFVAQDYINTLINEFDKDGVLDRQQEYKRTVKFVDSRSFFKERIRSNWRQKKVLKKNNLTDIKADASINIQQQIVYDSELFKSRSQKDLTSLLKETINENTYELMPINIGIENSNINQLIGSIILLLRIGTGLISAGTNNSYIKNLEKQLDDYLKNILISIQNYEISLELTIQRLIQKEDEFLLNTKIFSKWNGFEVYSERVRG